MALNGLYSADVPVRNYSFTLHCQLNKNENKKNFQTKITLTSSHIACSVYRETVSSFIHISVTNRFISLNREMVLT